MIIRTILDKSSYIHLEIKKTYDQKETSNIDILKISFHHLVRKVGLKYKALTPLHQSDHLRLIRDKKKFLVRRNYYFLAQT